MGMVLSPDKGIFERDVVWPGDATRPADRFHKRFQQCCSVWLEVRGKLCAQGCCGLRQLVGIQTDAHKAKCFQRGAATSRETKLRRESPTEEVLEIVVVIKDRAVTVHEAPCICEQVVHIRG